MTRTWILVANASQAHLYSAPRATLYQRDSALTSVKNFEHPQSRHKDLELAADRSGHLGHGTMVESSQLKQHEVESFARLLINTLENGRLQHQFDDLIVVAPPKFHGVLNHWLTPSLQHMRSLDVTKDYTAANDHQLMKYLQVYL